MTDKTSATKDKSAMSREERLVLRLRDNLRRRKAQARAMGAAGAAGDEAPGSGS